MRGSGSRKARSIGSCRRRSCDGDVLFFGIRRGCVLVGGRSFGAVPLLFFGVGLFSGAGMCARRRTCFLLLRQKKVGKEKATLVSVSPFAPAGRRGQPAVLGCGAAPWNSLRAGALRSDIPGESDHEAGVSCGTPARPAPCAPRRRHKGGGSTRAIAALGPWCASASHRAADLWGEALLVFGRAQRRPAFPQRPSAAMARVAPFWMRLGRAGGGVAGVPKDTPAS